jgi:predicted nucleic acid-binding protein
MIFVDSGAWIALLDPRDQFHERSVRFQRELRQGPHDRLVTTDYVLDEEVTYLRLHAGGTRSGSFAES